MALSQGNRIELLLKLYSIKVMDSQWKCQMSKSKCQMVDALGDVIDGVPEACPRSIKNGSILHLAFLIGHLTFFSVLDLGEKPGLCWLSGDLLYFSIQGGHGLVNPAVEPAVKVCPDRVRFEDRVLGYHAVQFFVRVDLRVQNWEHSFPIMAWYLAGLYSSIRYKNIK